MDQSRKHLVPHEPRQAKRRRLMGTQGFASVLARFLKWWRSREEKRPAGVFAPRLFHSLSVYSIQQKVAAVCDDFGPCLDYHSHSRKTSVGGSHSL